MKPLTLLLLLFIPLLNQAQDWYPKTNHYYHYTTGDSTTIQTIQLRHIPPSHGMTQYMVDSLLSIQVDTFLDNIGNIHYEPKKLLTVCDTCTTPTVQYRRTDLYPSLVKTSSGVQLIVLGLDTFPIAAHPANTSFDDTTKKIRGDTLYSYARQQDSIVVLQLENYNLPNPTIWEIGLSKKHGIASVKDTVNNQITLIGAEGQDSFGYQSLQFDDIFDFNVGDEFYYFEDRFNAHGTCGFSYIHNQLEYRHRILDRQNIGNDTIVYTVEVNTHASRCPPDIGIDTFTYVYTSDSTKNYNARQGNLTEGLSQNWHTATREFIFFNHIKYVGYDFGFPAGNSDPSHFRTNDSINYILHYWGEATLYTKGLGATYYNQTGFEHSNRIYLDAYIKGTDTFGIIPNMILSDLEQPAPSSPIIEIFPNPTNQLLYFSQPISGTISIYNQLGQPLLQKEVEQSSEIDLSALPSGQYWLQLNNEAVIWRKQVLIIR